MCVECLMQNYRKFEGDCDPERAYPALSRAAYLAAIVSGLSYDEAKDVAMSLNLYSEYRFDIYPNLRGYAHYKDYSREQWLEWADRVVEKGLAYVSQM